MEENHPYLMGYTIASLGVSILIFQNLLASVGNPTMGVVGYMALGISGLVVSGSIWLIVRTDSMKKWSTLSEWQKFLASLIMIPGFITGIVVIVIIAAIKKELGRQV